MTRRRPGRLPTAAAAALLMLPAAGCASSAEEGGRTLTVLAAASLTESFTDLATEFEAAHEGVDVRLAFDSSATLAQQARHGAPADLLATADLDSILAARDVLTTPPTPFASNALVLVTGPSAPEELDEVDDLDGPPGGDPATWVACVETAPCGRLAAEAIAAAGLASEPASREVDVKAVLTRVTSGEADAGFVYATDAVAAGDRVEVLDMPDRAGAAVPQLAPLEQAAEPGLAEEFVDLVLSGSGRAVLREHGFGTDVEPR